MALGRQEIEHLLSAGVEPEELRQGIEIQDEESHLVGISRIIKVHTPKEKGNLLYEQAKLLLKSNREKDSPLSGRNILQEIGGGSLKNGEWIQITPSPNSVFVCGSRGVHILKNK